MDGEQIARLFHETYERLAPSFGYETRPDTKAFDPTSANGRLMIAVCSEVANVIKPPLPDRFANDANAKALYDCWDDRPGWVPWVERGNSDMQEKARREAVPLDGGPVFNVDPHDLAIDDYFSGRGGS